MILLLHHSNSLPLLREEPQLEAVSLVDILHERGTPEGQVRVVEGGVVLLVHPDLCLVLESEVQPGGLVEDVEDVGLEDADVGEVVLLDFEDDLEDAPLVELILLDEGVGTLEVGVDSEVVHGDHVLEDDGLVLVELADFLAGREDAPVDGLDPVDVEVLLDHVHELGLLVGLDLEVELLAAVLDDLRVLVLEVEVVELLLGVLGREVLVELLQVAVRLDVLDLDRVPDLDVLVAHLLVVHQLHPEHAPVLVLQPEVPNEALEVGVPTMKIVMLSLVYLSLRVPLEPTHLRTQHLLLLLHDHLHQSRQTHPTSSTF